MLVYLVIVANPASSSATVSKSVPTSDLCALCVSTFSPPILPPFPFKHPARFTLGLKGMAGEASTFNSLFPRPSYFNFELSTFNRFAPISFRIRTYAKFTRNPCTMNTSKTHDLKAFRMNTYGKNLGEGYSDPCALPVIRVTQTAVIPSSASLSSQRPLFTFVTSLPSYLAPKPTPATLPLSLPPPV